MAEEKKKASEDATESRPVPSQAEGDEETVDKALRQHEQKDKQ